MIGSIAGERSWAYIWDKEAKHDCFFGSLAMRAFRRGHLLYHPAQGYEAGYLRNHALDLVELHSRNVGYNYRGQPGLTTTDQSKVVEFSSFPPALLHLAQVKANFGGESKASLRLNRQRRVDAGIVTGERPAQAPHDPAQRATPNPRKPKSQDSEIGSGRVGTAPIIAASGALLFS
jgi:hypothetical protein